MRRLRLPKDSAVVFRPVFVLKLIVAFVTRILFRLPRVAWGLYKLKSIDRLRPSWGAMVQDIAERHPHRPAVKSHEGLLTYAEFNARANRTAHWLKALGIKRGDVVNVMVETRPELLFIYSGIAKLGAINSMINTRLSGESLRAQLDMHPAVATIVGAECWDSYSGAGAKSPTAALAWVREAEKPDATCPDDARDLLEALDTQSEQNLAETQRVEPDDVLAYVFTSGTTGGSLKAARVTHRRVASSVFFNGHVVLGMKREDTLYLPLPFFHTNALALSWPACLARGSAVAIRRRFSASEFLYDVRQFNASTFCYIGELCRYLLRQPERPDDTDQPLTKVIGNGMRPDIWRAFQRRFGIPNVFEIYGGAESNLYFVNLLNLDCTVGMSITPYALVEANLDTGEPLKTEDGKVVPVKGTRPGLLLGKVTALTPFTGYSDPAETDKKLLRDLFEPGDAWFNTGDLMRRKGLGHLEFVDRLGDTFRWKGENVATAEVEEIANRLDEVAVSAAYGVEMPGGDGRIGMIAIVPSDDTSSPLEKLADHFIRDLPGHARPAFVRLVNAVEETETFKLKKFSLKEQGYDPTATKDPLYVLLPGESNYRTLTPEIHQRIQDSEVRF